MWTRRCEPTQAKLMLDVDNLHKVLAQLEKDRISQEQAAKVAKAEFMDRAEAHMKSSR